MFCCNTGTPGKHNLPLTCSVLLSGNYVIVLWWKIKNCFYINSACWAYIYFFCEHNTIVNLWKWSITEVQWASKSTMGTLRKRLEILSILEKVAKELKLAKVVVLCSCYWLSWWPFDIAFRRSQTLLQCSMTVDPSLLQVLS